MTALLFVVLVVMVAIPVVMAVSRAGGPLVAAWLVATHLVVPGLLAWSDALGRYSPLPAPALLVVLVVTLLTVLLTMSGAGAKLAASIGLPWLVAMQTFRVPVELLLHRLYREGVIPVEMTYSGRNFDIASGFTAAVLGGWMLSGGRPSKALLWAWNLLGLGLLVNIVTIAVLSTPVPFRQFTDGPPNLLPSTFPFVWLPTVLVQLALAGHLLVFRARTEG